MGFDETPGEEPRAEQSLPDRVMLAGYVGFALLIVGAVCGGMSGVALAFLGTLTILLSAVFVGYLFATNHPAARREL